MSAGCVSTDAFPSPGIATVYFLLEPGHVMNFPLKTRTLKFPAFKIVVDTTPPPVPDGYVLRTATDVGVVEAVAFNYTELNAKIARPYTDYWVHRDQVTQSLRLWETIVSRLDKWHSAVFDK